MASPIASPAMVPWKFDGLSSVSKPLPSKNETVWPAATELENSSSARSPIVNVPLPVTAPPMKAEAFASTFTKLDTRELLNARLPAALKKLAPAILIVPALLIALTPVPNQFDPLTFQIPPLLLLNVAVANPTLPDIVPVLLMVRPPL